MFGEDRIGGGGRGGRQPAAPVGAEWCGGGSGEGNAGPPVRVRGAAELRVRPFRAASRCGSRCPPLPSPFPPVPEQTAAFPSTGWRGEGADRKRLGRLQPYLRCHGVSVPGRDPPALCNGPGGGARCRRVPPTPPRSALKAAEAAELHRTPWGGPRPRCAWRRCCSWWTDGRCECGAAGRKRGRGCKGRWGAGGRGGGGGVHGALAAYRTAIGEWDA